MKISQACLLTSGPLLLIFTILFCVPVAYYDSLRIAGYPGYQVVLFLIALVSGVLFLLGRRGPKRLWVHVGVGLGSIAIGSLLNWRNSNATLGSILYDLAVIVALLSGVVISLNCNRRALQGLVVMIQHGCLIALVVVMFLLKVGVVPQFEKGSRIYDPAMFFSASIMVILLPAAVAVYAGGRQFIQALATLLLTTAAAAFCADMSATRSIVVVSVAAAITASFLVFRARSARIAVVAMLLLGCGFTVALAGQDIFQNLNARVENEGYSSAARVDETAEMFRQIGGRLITGLGLGGAFYSGIVWDSNPDGLDWAPHVGILTPLLKGGVLCMVALVLWPAYAMCRRLFSKRVSHYKKAFLYSIIVYIIQSIVSGGYHCGPILILGLLIGSYSQNGKFNSKPEHHG